MTPLRHVPRPAGALPPGSERALRQGCTCPPFENHFGRGTETFGAPTYLVRDTCPVHGDGDGATPRALEPTDVGTYTAPLPTPRAKRVIAQPQAKRDATAPKPEKLCAKCGQPAARKPGARGPRPPVCWGGCATTTGGGR